MLHSQLACVHYKDIDGGITDFTRFPSLQTGNAR